MSRYVQEAHQNRHINDQYQWVFLIEPLHGIFLGVKAGTQPQVRESRHESLAKRVVYKT